MKIMDKFKNSIKLSKKYLIFLVILGIIALVCGSFFNIVLNSSDKELVKEYITNFLDNINTNNYVFKDILINGSISNGIYISLIWFLGISIIGLPIILFLYFYKVFVLGFSIAGIISNYGIKGLLLAFSYIFPTYILYLVSITILAIYALGLSIKLFKTIIRKDKLDFKLIMNKYTYILLISIIFSALGLLSETFILPAFTKFILSIIV